MPDLHLLYEGCSLTTFRDFLRLHVQCLMNNIPAGELLKVVQELHSGISCEATLGKTLEI